ncbi:MAG TPA: prepilin-type N-terminal cleavage/methylation domain-containing protein [Myxococcaceae bacterium]|nr:prepilin-type N-terminal cleavage/methylation domain-containing protein [Myxococcaceae bacterium]
MRRPVTGAKGFKRCKAAHHARGVTLIELAVAVALAGILLTLAWNGMRSLPKMARLSSSVVELSSELTQARGRATGKKVRTAVLLSATQREFQYLEVEDPGLTLDNVLRSRAGWPTFAAGTSSAPPRIIAGGKPYTVVGQGKLSGDLALAPQGHKGLMDDKTHPRCSGAGSDYVTVADGNGGGYFPPPYCRIPAQSGCTFCSVDGTATRGIILFEPDGRVRLFDAAGNESLARAGSISFHVPSLGKSQGATVALTSTGMIRTFRGGGRR